MAARGQIRKMGNKKKKVNESKVKPSEKVWSHDHDQDSLSIAAMLPSKPSSQHYTTHHPLLSLSAYTRKHGAVVHPS